MCGNWRITPKFPLVRHNNTCFRLLPSCMFRRCRPVALFIPLAAIVFSLKNCEGYIRAILVKQLESEKLSRGAGKTLSDPTLIALMSVRLLTCDGCFPAVAGSTC